MIVTKYRPQAKEYGLADVIDVFGTGFSHWQNSRSLEYYHRKIGRSRETVWTPAFTKGMELVNLWKRANHKGYGLRYVEPFKMVMGKHPPAIEFPEDFDPNAPVEVMNPRLSNWTPVCIVETVEGQQDADDVAQDIDRMVRIFEADKRFTEVDHQWTFRPIRYNLTDKWTVSATSTASSSDTWTTVSSSGGGVWQPAEASRYVYGGGTGRRERVHEEPQPVDGNTRGYSVGYSYRTADIVEEIAPAPSPEDYGRFIERLRAEPIRNGEDNTLTIN